MFTLLAMLGLFDPPLSDLDRFPTRCTAQEQVVRCQEHLERLRRLQGVHGWQGGFWADCIRETERQRHYWLLVAEARDEWLVSETWRRNRLAQLKVLLGDADYLAGWRPSEIPEASRFAEIERTMSPAKNP